MGKVFPRPTGEVQGDPTKMRQGDSLECNYGFGASHSGLSKGDVRRGFKPLGPLDGTDSDPPKPQ